jgi:hypothetical protein
MNRQRLRAVQRRMRESHRKLFDVQGESIAALREALDAISRTHDEMLTLFETDADLDDAIEEDDDKG